MSTKTTNRIDQRERYGIEFRSPSGRKWVLLGTAGSYRQAQLWTTRFFGSGSYRVRMPRRPAGTFQEHLARDGGASHAA